jgi:DNA-directed RNA polymerase specialized sigma24 family protein
MGTTVINNARREAAERIERVRPQIEAHIRTLLGRRNRADFDTQCVYSTACRELDRRIASGKLTASQSDPAAYVRRVARSKLIDAHRVMQPRRAAEEGFASERPGASPAPSLVELDGDETDLRIAAMRAGGYKVREIAVRLGLSESVVKVRLMRMARRNR